MAVQIGGFLEADERPTGRHLDPVAPRAPEACTHNAPARRGIGLRRAREADVALPFLTDAGRQPPTALGVHVEGGQILRTREIWIQRCDGGPQPDHCGRR